MKMEMELKNPKSLINLEDLLSRRKRERLVVEQLVDLEIR